VPVGAERLNRRIRLSVLDTLGTATLGPRGRPLRAVLSDIGVAIGIASLVAVLGIPAVLQAEAKAEFDAWGANLLIVSPAVDRRTQEVTPIPETAPAMVGRIWPVKAALTIQYVPDVGVYRTDTIPVEQSQGLSVAIVTGDPLGTLGTTLAAGRWFDDASSNLPTVVLGATAARLLGTDVGQRIWIGQSWWAVIGVLGSLPGFAGQLDSTAFVAPGWAEQWWPDQPISQILVNAYPGQANAVKSVLAATVNPAQPSKVDISTPTQYLAIQNYVLGLFSTLALGLGGIALLVGGIGIANTMVVSVMERRGEIGLRRALGARTGQIGLQFVLEAGVIGLLGGILGVALGVYAVFLFAAWFSYRFAIPGWVLAAGPGIAIVVGVLAGLYPSLKAARQTPTAALRVV